LLSKILLAIQYYRRLKNIKIKYEKFKDPTLENIFLELEGWASDRKDEVEQLKKLELYRKEYIGNISHELKTPIFNIQGYILTLLDGALEDVNVNRDYLTRTERSVERMINMVEDLESISQLEAGQLEIEQERFDLTALLKDVCDTQEMSATSKGIILSIKLLKDLPLYVIADKFRIRQVLTNLIVNSIKYGKEYGETNVKLFEREENISIEITDNGIGISQEHLPRLFERFYRVDKSRSRDQGGTGLGLSIVKHILEAHGQTISVTSRLGEGTSFTFSLKKG
jgi:two-component system phosphate regulon sensor histidine kinase PhoR